MLHSAEQQTELQKLNASVQKNSNNRPCLTPHTETISEWIIDLNAKPKRIKKKRNLKQQSLYYICMLSPSSRVQHCVTPWTVAHQSPWDSPGRNTGVGSRVFLHPI